MRYGSVRSADEIPRSDLVGFDIETSPLQEYLRQGWTPPPDPRLTKIVMAQVCVGTNVYILTQNFESLKPLLEDKHVKKVIHEGKFEYKHLFHHFGIRIRNIADTLLLEGILENGHRPDLNLKAVALKYCDILLSKVARDKFVRGEVVDHAMTFYGAKDAWVLPKIYAAMEVIPKYDGFDKVKTLETALIPAFVDIELRGFRLSRRLWQPLAEEIEGQYETVRRKLLKALPTKIKQMTMFGDAESSINLNSRIVMQKIFSDAGLVLPNLKKTTVAEYLEKTPHPLLALYSRYTKLQKAKSTYGFGFLDNINPVTGRVHQNIQAVNARTGRLAGRDPNLMNIPKDDRTRGCFCAAKGKLLVGGDFSQQELGVLAQFSEDKNLILGFESGLDLHLYTARLMFKDKSIEKDDKRRSAAKNVNFGIMYGMGVVKLAISLKISVEEAQELLDFHRQQFAGVHEWAQGIIEFARQNGYVQTLLGRVRYLDRDIFNYEQQARNTPIQGSAADMTKLAVYKLWQQIDIVNIVHDEIVTEVDIADAPEVAKALHAGMQWAAHYLVKKVDIKVDTYTNKFWIKGD